MKDVPIWVVPETDSFQGVRPNRSAIHDSGIVFVAYVTGIFPATGPSPPVQFRSAACEQVTCRITRTSSQPTGCGGSACATDAA